MTSTQKQKNRPPSPGSVRKQSSACRAAAPSHELRCSESLRGEVRCSGQGRRRECSPTNNNNSNNTATTSQSRRMRWTRQSWLSVGAFLKSQEEGERKKGGEGRRGAEESEAALHHCHAAVAPTTHSRDEAEAAAAYAPLNVLGGSPCPRWVNIIRRLHHSSIPPPLLLIYLLLVLHTRSRSVGSTLASGETRTAFWGRATARVYMAAIRTEPVLLR